MNDGVLWRRQKIWLSERFYLLFIDIEVLGFFNGDVIFWKSNAEQQQSLKFLDASSTYQWRDSFSIRAHKKSEFSFQLSTQIINVRSLIYVGYILIQHSSCCNSYNNKFMLASGDESRMIGNLTNTEDTIPYSECFHYPCLQLSTCHSLPVGFYCECQLGYTGKWCLNSVYVNIGVIFLFSGNSQWFLYLTQVDVERLMITLLFWTTTPLAKDQCQTLNNDSQLGRRLIPLTIFTILISDFWFRLNSIQLIWIWRFPQTWF